MSQKKEPLRVVSWNGFLARTQNLTLKRNMWQEGVFRSISIANMVDITLIFLKREKETRVVWRRKNNVNREIFWTSSSIVQRRPPRKKPKENDGEEEGIRLLATKRSLPKEKDEWLLWNESSFSKPRNGRRREGSRVEGRFGVLSIPKASLY
jgi:hypothetical protein